MKLTDRERLLIARRAMGEHSIIPNVRMIVSSHRKNRTPNDQIFLEFARLTVKKSWDMDDYERLARGVLEIIPEPYGTPWWKRSQPAGTSTPTKQRRVSRCRICSEPGHNARTCPDKPSDGSATVDCADGLTRLAPGFDPNPPAEVEEDT
jgi:hypothetical protein